MVMPSGASCWYCLFFWGGEPMATGFSCQGNVVVPWRRSCHCPWSGAPFKMGLNFVIVHVPWKSSSIWSGSWKIHVTSKMYLQKHVIWYIGILWYTHVIYQPNTYLKWYIKKALQVADLALNQSKPVKLSWLLEDSKAPKKISITKPSMLWMAKI